MLRIDGSFGEGGGQILRTALALSCVTKTPIEIFNIRKGRKNPGLQPQHLASVRACARISNARVEGGMLGSTELKFMPGDLTSGDYEFNVAEEKGSAGSVSLVIQSILLPLLYCPGESQVTIKGGTHVPFSPPFDYLAKVWLPFLGKLGVKAEAEIVKYGFYPKGGGEVRLKVKPVKKLQGINLLERGKLVSVSGISAVANLPETIALRQKQEAKKVLNKESLEPKIEVKQVNSVGAGTYLFLWTEFENSLAGFSSLGERGKPAEKVAQDACQGMLEFLEIQAAMEEHLADQVLPYLALAKEESSFTVSKITSHLLTNVWVVERLLPAKIMVEGESGRSGKVAILLQRK
jgi:RNA 3'-terminal phosphate cyclase (ATP)